MNQQIIEGENSLNEIPSLLRNSNLTKIFLVTGKKKYLSTPILDLLKNFQVTHFNNFSANPQLNEIENGIQLFNFNTSDVVIGIGGGSALDVAKIIRYQTNPQTPYWAIPTTAGTGSESTQFATYYIDHIKHSLDKTRALPNLAILDYNLTTDLPPYITACTGMDALAQAIESYWNVQSNDKSKQLAKLAIETLWNTVESAVINPTKQSRKTMLIGANLAGQAINITRTTAAHAISYPITSFFNLPHGHAVNLTLPYFFELNQDINEHNCADPRGVNYVKQTMTEIFTFLSAKDGAHARQLYQSKMKKIGLSLKLSEFGIKESDIERICQNSFNPARMKNNPRKIDMDILLDLFSKKDFYLS